MSSFNAISRRYIHKLLAQEKNLNSASKMANYVIVDTHKYL